MNHKFILFIIITCLIIVSHGLPTDVFTETSKFDDNNLSEYKLVKEMMKVEDYEYHFHDGQKEFQYELTKEYIYKDDKIETKYNLDATCIIYNDDGSIREKRPMKEGEDKDEWTNGDFYLENMDEIVNDVKDPKNTVNPTGDIRTNSQGQVIEEVIYNERGEKFIHKYNYDKKGRLIRKELNSNIQGYFSKYSYTYDEHNRVINVHAGHGMMGSEDTSYTYDDRGLLVKIKHSSRSDTMRGTDFTFTFEYKKR
jgi:YD repeat-containing protein